MVTEEELVEFLKIQEKPVSPAAILQFARQKGPGANRKSVEKILQALLASRRVHHLQSGGKSAGYTVTPPIVMTAASLLSHLKEADAPVNLTEARKAVGKVLQPWFDEALGQLVTTGSVSYFQRGAVRHVLARAPKPSDSLDDRSRKSLESIVAKINLSRKSPVSVAQMLSWLDESSAKEDFPTRPTAEEFRRWYEEDQKSMPSKMIPIRKTWKRYERWMNDQDTTAEPSVFRQAMREYYEAGQILLEPPERPQDIPEEEREILVPQRIGAPAYYWCWIAPLSTGHHS